MTVSFRLEEFPDGEATCVDVSGEPVCVVRVDDKVYAIGDICTHQDISLSDGEVYAEDLEIECPAHGSVFSLVDGCPATLPATEPVAVYEATVADGTVTLRKSDSTGGAR